MGKFLFLSILIISCELTNVGSKTVYLSDASELVIRPGESVYTIHDSIEFKVDAKLKDGSEVEPESVHWESDLFNRSTKKTFRKRIFILGKHTIKCKVLFSDGSQKEATFILVIKEYSQPIGDLYWPLREGNKWNYNEYNEKDSLISESSYDVINSYFVTNDGYLIYNVAHHYNSSSDTLVIFPTLNGKISIDNEFRYEFNFINGDRTSKDELVKVIGDSMIFTKNSFSDSDVLVFEEYIFLKKIGLLNHTKKFKDGTESRTKIKKAVINGHIYTY